INAPYISVKFKNSDRYIRSFADPAAHFSAITSKIALYDFLNQAYILLEITEPIGKLLRQ
ncbi:MAG TPA: hypothetical protein VHH35_18460, partial [Pyrinomonadaceae bacterium]|nr:hypothetical protein [Pyrinomonadaceae bacterium]